MPVWLIKWIIMALVLYGVSFLFAGRIQFKGIVPALTSALIITPVCVFASEINGIIGLKTEGVWILGGAAIYCAVALAICEKVVPDVRVENFMSGLAYSVAAGALSLLLFMLTEHSSFFGF